MTDIYLRRFSLTISRYATLYLDQFSSVETSCVIIEMSETWLNLVRECGRLRGDPFVSISPQMGRLAADLYVQAQQRDTAAPLAMEGLSYALG
jgi:hypothetical protein